MFTDCFLLQTLSKCENLRSDPLFSHVLLNLLDDNVRQTLFHLLLAKGLTFNDNLDRLALQALNSLNLLTINNDRVFLEQSFHAGLIRALGTILPSGYFLTVPGHNLKNDDSLKKFNLVLSLLVEDENKEGPATKNRKVSSHFISKEAKNQELKKIQNGSGVDRNGGIKESSNKFQNLSGTKLYEGSINATTPENHKGNGKFGLLDQKGEIYIDKLSSKQKCQHDRKTRALLNKILLFAGLKSENITHDGFTFLLKSKREQLTHFLLAGIERIVGSNDKDKTLLFLFLFDMGNYGGKWLKINKNDQKPCENAVCSNTQNKQDPEMYTQPQENMNTPVLSIQNHPDFSKYSTKHLIQSITKGEHEPSYSNGSENDENPSEHHLGRENKRASEDKSNYDRDVLKRLEGDDISQRRSSKSIPNPINKNIPVSVQRILPLIDQLLEILYHIGAISLDRELSKPMRYTDCCFRVTSVYYSIFCSEHSVHKFLILETNYKLYCMDISDHTISVLALFSNIQNILPNLITCNVDERSINRALSKGITGQQICNYISNRSTKEVNEIVLEQILIWEKNRNRIYSTPAILYDHFTSFSEFQAIFTYCKNFMLCFDRDKRVIVVKEDDHHKVKEFIKKNIKR